MNAVVLQCDRDARPASPLPGPSPWLDRTLDALEGWLRHPLVWVLACFILSRLTLEAIGLASREGYSELIGKLYQWFMVKQTWLDIWAAWDSGWYVDIVEHGYDKFVLKTLPDGAPEQLNLAFFPLYPLLVWLLKQVTGNAVVAGVLLANASLLGAMWLLYVYGRERWDETQARLAVLLLAFYPNTFIFSCMYTESLFLLLLIACMLAASRGRWMWVGVFGGLLTATRVPGMAVGLALLWMWIVQKRAGKATWGGFCWMFLVPLGLVGFCVFLHFHAGDALAFLKIQQQFSRVSQTPPEAIWKSLQQGGPDDLYFTAYFLGSLALTGVLVLCRRTDELLLSLPLMLLPLFSGEMSTPLVAIPRYLLVVFPLYGALAWLGTRRPLLFWAIFLCLATWSGMLMAAWTSSLKFVM
ncbi:hypothetical protein [Megalodesulfovibrio paquesii]